MTNKMNDIENFDPENPACTLTNDKLKLFHDFLECPDYIKMFVWCDFGETKSFCWSFDMIPKFYGKKPAN